MPPYLSNRTVLIPCLLTMESEDTSTLRGATRLLARTPFHKHPRALLPSPKQGRESRDFSQGKNAVRTDDVPPDIRSPAKIQTTQTPPRLGASPSRSYPPNTSLPCNPAANLAPRLFNALPPRAPPPPWNQMHTSVIPSRHSPFRPTTFFPLPARRFLTDRTRCHSRCSGPILLPRRRKSSARVAQHSGARRNPELPAVSNLASASHPAAKKKTAASRLLLAAVCDLLAVPSDY